MKTLPIVCSAFVVLLALACTSEPKSNGAPSTEPPPPTKASDVVASLDSTPQGLPSCEPLEAATLTAGFVPPESPRNTRISILRRSRFVRCKGAPPVPYPESLQPSKDGWGEAYPVTSINLADATLNPWERGAITGLPVTEQGGLCPDKSLHPMSTGTCEDSKAILVPLPEVQFEHQYTFSLKAPFHKPVEVVVGPDDWDFDPRVAMHGKWVKEPLAQWDRVALSQALSEGFVMARCARSSVQIELDGQLKAQVQTASEIANRAGADSPLSDKNYQACIAATLNQRMNRLTEGSLEELPTKVQSRLLQRAGLDEPLLRAVEQEMPGLLAETEAEVTERFEAGEIQCDLSPALISYFQCEFQSGPKSSADDSACPAPEPRQTAKELALAPTPVLIRESSFEKVDYSPAPRWYKEQLGRKASGRVKKDFRLREIEEEELEEEIDMDEESEFPSEYAMFPPVRRTGRPIGAPSVSGPWEGQPEVHAYLRSTIVGQKGCDASPIVDQIGPVLEASALCCGALVTKDTLDGPGQVDTFLYFEAGKTSGGAKVLSPDFPSGSVRKCLFDVGEHLELNATLPQPCGILVPMEVSPTVQGKFGLGSNGSGSLGTRGLLREPKRRIKMRFGSITVGGKCDKRDITMTIKRRAAAFRRCYQMSLQKDPTVLGKLTAKVAISETGRAMGAKVVAEATNMEPVAVCASKFLGRFHFKKPSSGICTAEFSIVFSYEK